MKKVAVLMAVLFMCGVVIAQPIMPCPIAVKVNAFPGGDIPVKITNLNTLEVVSGKTTEAGLTGEYVVDWANTVKKYSYGDTFRIEVLDMKKEVKFTGSPIEIQYYDLIRGCIIKQTINPGDTYRNIDNACNVEVTATVNPIEIVKPLTDYPLEVLVLFIIGALVGTTGYVKLYPKGASSIGLKVVNGKTLHSHKNISGYHDPNTVHSYQPHKKGELNPKYSTVKNADGKYNYIGV